MRARGATTLMEGASVSTFGTQVANLLERLPEALAALVPEKSSAISTARDAGGRRAHHRCKVEGYPCRIHLSRDACLDTSAMGKSTSASRLHSARNQSSVFSFHNRTMNRSSSSMRSVSVPLCARMPSTILRGTPRPVASM